jgi:hypothetical protein
MKTYVHTSLCVTTSKHREMLPYSVAGERCVTKLAYRGSDASSSSFAISVLPVSRALGLAIWLLDSGTVVICLGKQI